MPVAGAAAIAGHIISAVGAVASAGSAVGLTLWSMDESRKMSEQQMRDSFAENKRETEEYTRRSNDEATARRVGTGANYR